MTYALSCWQNKNKIIYHFIILRYKVPGPLKMWDKWTFCPKPQAMGGPDWIADGIYTLKYGPGKPLVVQFLPMDKNMI